MKIKKIFHKEEYIRWILTNFSFIEKNSEYEYAKNGNKISINPSNNYWFFEEVKTEHGKVWSLLIEENIITLILCLKLLEKGYNKMNIILEKSFRLGHNSKGYVDVAIEKDNKILS